MKISIDSGNTYFNTISNYFYYFNEPIIESISPIFALENQPFYLRFYGINFQTFINDNKYQNKINILSKCIFGKENYNLSIINNNEAFCLIVNCCPSKLIPTEWEPIFEFLIKQNASLLFIIESL